MACASGFAVRSPDGVRVLAVNFQCHPNPADATHNGRSECARHPRRITAKPDLEVNVKAEREIEVILRHLEYKNFMLNAMLENRGVTVADDQDRSNL